MLAQDLLAPLDGSGLPPEVRALEDAEGELRVGLPALTEAVVVEEAGAAEALRTGHAHRRQGANAIHAHSSRSHAVLQLELRDAADAAQPPAGAAPEALLRLTLVDLAGSERASETMTDDAQTRQEGAEINRSLLALKECIRALDSGDAHTPFRGSKLTQVLRDCLSPLASSSHGGGGGGGDARAVMIATVSPAERWLDHTLNTLRYADRLKELSAGAGAGVGRSTPSPGAKQPRK